MPVTGTGTGLRRFLCPGQEKKRGVSNGEPPALSSPTGICSRRRVVCGVMEFGMSRRIKPKIISMKETWTVRRKIKNCGAT